MKEIKSLTNLTPVSRKKAQRKKRKIVNKVKDSLKETTELRSCKEPPSSTTAVDEQPPTSVQDENPHVPDEPPSHTSSPMYRKITKDNTPNRSNHNEIRKPASSSTDLQAVESLRKVLNYDSSEEKNEPDYEGASERSNIECSLHSLSSNSSLLGSVNHPAKRYILIQQENGSSDQIVHVWGPSIGGSQTCTVRTAADQCGQNK